MIPAAAVKARHVVLLSVEEGGTRRPRTVTKVENSTPVPGRITWHLEDGTTHEVGGAQLVDTIY